MNIGILGPVRLESAGRSLPVRAKKVRALLAVLALAAGNAVSYDELIEELWYDKRLNNARNALQANITRLRRLFEEVLAGEAVAPEYQPRPIQALGSGYLLEIDRRSVDALQFLSLAEHGIKLVEHDPRRAIPLLIAASDLWRGPALLDARDGQRCRAAAMRLDEVRVDCREALITARLAVGEERKVIPELRELVAQYPERERFSEQLMVALYRCNRRTEALDAFHRTRLWLVSEIGVEPSQSLSNVYQAILTSAELT